MSYQYQFAPCDKKRIVISTSTTYYRNNNVNQNAFDKYYDYTDITVMKWAYVENK